MKIAFFDTKPYDKPSFDKFGAEKGIKFKYFETKLNEDTVDLAHGFDGVCVFVNDTVNAAVIDRLAEMGVRLVALRCAGFNNVDVKHAFGKIHILRVPAYSPYAVAEHAMAMLLTSIRRIHKAYIRTRDFNFSLVNMTGFDLHGKTVGVIGTGRIGRVFIDICRGFGMKVLAYDKFPAEGLDNGDTIRYTELDELFKNSDIISLHCPLTPLTEGMVNADFLSKMKPSAVLINTSRGQVINEADLAHALKNGVIAAAGLDHEPVVARLDRRRHVRREELRARDLVHGNGEGDAQRVLQINLRALVVHHHVEPRNAERLDSVYDVHRARRVEIHHVVDAHPCHRGVGHHLGGLVHEREPDVVVEPDGEFKRVALPVERRIRGRE